MVHFDPQAPLDEQLDTLYKIARTDQPRADELLDGLLADSRFGAQGPSLRHDAYSFSTWLALQSGDYKRALESSRQSVAADPKVMQDWYPLAQLEYTAGNLEAAARALVYLAEHWPEEAATADLPMVSQLVFQFKLPPQARLDLLQALTAANWMQGRSAGSSLWYELALMQLLDGQIEQARASAQQVYSPDAIINLRNDRQFDPLIDRNSTRFDVGLAAKNQIETLQKLASAAPDSLDLRNELNDAMLSAGMTQEALIHADLILSKLAQLSEDDTLFADLEDKIWTMNNRAVALRRLGRNEEAIQQLEIASRLGENGSPNVSQILNLAQGYCSMGRPQQARATLDRLGDGLSPYGQMVKASSEHRIAVQTNDMMAASKSLDYLYQNRGISYTLYVWALLQTQQVDQAASLMKELLGTPENRKEALGWAQQTLEAPTQPADVVPVANLKALLARADVQAAIAQVGYVEQYPIFTGYMRD